MKHEKQKQTIINSMMGYATHKKISVDDFFKQSKEIKTHKEIKALKSRQGKTIDEEALSKNWIGNG